MKDYKKLEERINKDKEITIGSITELGYSRYDINQFIDAGILSRLKRGVYTYLPELTKVEHQVVETPAAEPDEEPDINEQLFQLVNQGVYNLMKRQNEQAICLFDKALEFQPTHGRALIGLVGAYVFQNNYEKAYNYLIEFYNTREDNSLLYNIYYYLCILKQHITIEESLLVSIKEEIDNNKDTIKKLNPNFKRLHKAIDEEDYLEALKYTNFSISIDKKDKKYHITNHIYKALIMSTLKLKGIDPFASIAEYKARKGIEFVRQNQEEKPVPSEVPVVEEVVIVPETKIEDTIKTNLLLEAISNNDYELALSLLEKEQIDNPLEVIKTLLSKLAMIKSLITSNTQVKVVEQQTVHIVEEKHIEESLQSPVEAKVEETLIETTPVVEMLVVEEKIPTQEELIDIAYKAYKDAYHTEQFDEALKNLRRYEFLNNSNGTQRNINYHRIRIEQSKKDYDNDPERYIKKKALSKVIFDLKREKRYDAALEAIAEYKTLGGVKNELVILVEAEIYYALNELGKVSVILNGIRTSEEPSFFILSSKLAFRNYKFQEALTFCQAYNERRPNQSPSNYQLIGDCYTRLGKPGKAIKAYRKAEEVASQYGGKTLDLSSKISRQEMFSEFKKEERTTRNLAKKK